MAQIAPTTPPRQRIARERDKKYLEFIGSLVCCLCGAEPECAHVRFTEACSVCRGHGMEEFPDSRDFPETPYSEYRYLPCVSCNATGYRYAKRPVGAAETASDTWALPMCPNHHRMTNQAQHANGERLWWQQQGIDPLTLCVALQDAYALSRGNRAKAVELGMAVLENARG